MERFIFSATKKTFKKTHKIAREFARSKRIFLSFSREVNIFVLPRRRAILFLSSYRVRAHLKNMKRVGRRRRRVFISLSFSFVMLFSERFRSFGYDVEAERGKSSKTFRRKRESCGEL